jgi:hypothetical protein
VIDGQREPQMEQIRELQVNLRAWSIERKTTDWESEVNRDFSRSPTLGIVEDFIVVGWPFNFRNRIGIQKVHPVSKIDLKGGKDPFSADKSPSHDPLLSNDGSF